jgi:GntR family transcriptional regulator, vanillate catabolism transcriptional regulator
MSKRQDAVQEPAGDTQIRNFPLEASSNQTERAVQGVREMILRGELQAGERLTELSLVARLQVSRTPIRSALLRLTEEGLLEPASATGFVVRSFSEDEVFDSIEIRGTLEGLAARRAAERGLSPELQTQMRQCLAQIESLLAESSPGGTHLSRYAALNGRFHALIMAAADSAMLNNTLDKILNLPFASPSAFVEVQSHLPGSLEILRQAQAQHWDILDALLSRSSARAEPLMREHARSARKNLELVLADQTARQQMHGASLIRSTPTQGQ